MAIEKLQTGISIGTNLVNTVNGLVDSGVTVQTLADAVALTESGNMGAGGVVSVVDSGVSYQLIDAGASGDRPAENDLSVIYIGDGGLYLVETSNKNRLPEINISEILNTSLQPNWDKSTFETAIAAGSCVVTFVGTSITVGIAENENQNTWVNRFKRHLQFKYPTVDFEFHNLGLAGQSLVRYVDAGFVGLASAPVDPSSGYYVEANPDTWPTGSTVGQTWMAAAEATAPDLFVLAHGMNDRDYPYTYQGYLNTAINDALGWSKTPSVALVADMLPYAESAAFNQISWVSDYTRWYAAYNGYGLLDVGRAWRAIRYNIDSLLVTARRQDSIADWVKSGSDSTLTDDSFSTTETANATITKTGDYAGMRFSFDWTPVNNQADWYIACNILSTGDTDNGCVYIERTGSLINIRKRPVAGVEQSFAISPPVAATAEAWDIRVVRCWIEIYREGLLVGKFMHKQSNGSGGVSFSQNRASATNIVCDLNDQSGVFGHITASDDELLGTTQGAWQAGDFEVGGNAINHPSRLAVDKIFDPVIRDFINKL